MQLQRSTPAAWKYSEEQAKQACTRLPVVTVFAGNPVDALFLQPQQERRSAWKKFDGNTDSSAQQLHNAGELQHSEAQDVPQRSKLLSEDRSWSRGIFKTSLHAWAARTSSLATFL